MASPTDREMSRPVRIAFAPIMGIIFGIFIVKLLDRSDPYRIFGQFTFARGLFAFISEAVVGFGIGVSGLRMPWPLHGGLLGIIFSLPMAIWLGRLYSPASFNPRLFFLIIILNVLFGLLTELVLSGLLKARSYQEPAKNADPTDQKPVKLG